MTQANFPKYEDLLLALLAGKTIQRLYKEGWEDMPWDNALRAIAVLVDINKLRIKA